MYSIELEEDHEAVGVQAPENVFPWNTIGRNYTDLQSDVSSVFSEDSLISTSPDTNAFTNKHAHQGHQESEVFSLAREGGIHRLEKLYKEGYFNFVSVSDHQGWTILHHAAWGGHVNILRFLVEKVKCDPCVADVSGWIPLHCAAQHRKKEAFRYLLKTFPEGELKKDNFGNTPKDYAGKNL